VSTYESIAVVAHLVDTPTGLGVPQETIGLIGGALAS
jgi:hypothetical protein